MSSSAKRALRILEAVGRSDRALSVTEIAHALSLPPGTVFRSLDALARADLVRRYQASSRYVLGGGAERLQRSLIAGFHMREAVLPYLRQLASLSGETASLHARLGWYGLRVASAPGTAEVTNTPPLGEARPLGQHYAGRAILAFLAPGEIMDYRAWTAEQGSSPLHMLDHELAATRARGFAVGDSDGGRPSSIAFPVLAQNRPIAAIAIEGPVFARGRTGPEILAGWREIVRHVETLARTQPGLFGNPFAHLDPQSIVL